jgi:hypothetical protein
MAQLLKKIEDRLSGWRSLAHEMLKKLRIAFRNGAILRVGC